MKTLTEEIRTEEIRKLESFLIKSETRPAEFNIDDLRNTVTTKEGIQHILIHFRRFNQVQQPQVIGMMLPIMEAQLDMARDLAELILPNKYTQGEIERLHAIYSQLKTTKFNIVRLLQQEQGTLSIETSNKIALLRNQTVLTVLAPVILDTLFANRQADRGFSNCPLNQWELDYNTFTTPLNQAQVPEAQLKQNIRQLLNNYVNPRNLKIFPTHPNRHHQQAAQTILDILDDEESTISEIKTALNNAFTQEMLKRSDNTLWEMLKIAVAAKNRYSVNNNITSFFEGSFVSRVLYSLHQIHEFHQVNTPLETISTASKQASLENN